MLCQRYRMVPFVLSIDTFSFVKLSGDMFFFLNLNE
jgi:hypothetical protein